MSMSLIWVIINLPCMSWRMLFRKDWNTEEALANQYGIIRYSKCLAVVLKAAFYSSPSLTGLQS